MLARLGQQTELTQHEGRVEVATLPDDPIIFVEDEHGTRWNFEMTPSRGHAEPRPAVRAAQHHFYRDRLLPDMQALDRLSGILRSVKLLYYQLLMSTYRCSNILRSESSGAPDL